MLLLRYLTALALTLAVEVPLYAVLLRWGWHHRWRRAVLVAVGVNLVTHPPLWWLLLPMVSHSWYGWFLLAAEGGVCVAEWLLLARWLQDLPPARHLPALRRRHRYWHRYWHRWDPLLLVLSVAANASSVLVGLVAAGLIGSVG